MNNIDFESLFKFKPFNKISKDSRKILKENVNIISLNPGEIIIDKDASNDFIYILKSGSARVLGSNKSNKLVSFFNFHKEILLDLLHILMIQMSMLLLQEL